MNIDEIRESLITQAQRKGADVAFVREQIESYCKYAQLEAKMWKDIEENGKTVKMTSSVGKESERENPAVKMAMSCSKQKLDILKRLNLSLDTVIPEKSEDDDI